jgi:hypothetical protein
MKLKSNPTLRQIFETSKLVNADTWRGISKSRFVMILSKFHFETNATARYFRVRKRSIYWLRTKWRLRNCDLFEGTPNKRGWLVADGEPEPRYPQKRWKDQSKEITKLTERVD